MNKTLITFFTVLFCLTSSLGWSLEYKGLEKRDGIYYKKFTEVPFNGKVEGQIQGSIRNGKRDGSWVRYHDNGQLHYKGDYKNGKRDGSWIFYHDNEKIAAKGNYKNGMVEGYWVFNEFVYGLRGLANPSADQKTGTYKYGKRISDSWSLDYRTISENKDYKIGNCVGLAFTAMGRNMWTVKETSKDIKLLLKKNEKRVKKFHPLLKTCKHAFTSGVTEVAVEKMYKCLTKYSSKKDAYFGAGVTESIIISKLPIVNTKAKMSMAIGSFCTIALN